MRHGLPSAPTCPVAPRRLCARARGRARGWPRGRPRPWAVAVQPLQGVGVRVDDGLRRVRAGMASMGRRNVSWHRVAMQVSMLRQSRIRAANRIPFAAAAAAAAATTATARMRACIVMLLPRSGVAPGTSVRCGGKGGGGRAMPHPKGRLWHSMAHLTVHNRRRRHGGPPGLRWAVAVGGGRGGSRQQRPAAHCIARRIKADRAVAGWGRGRQRRMLVMMSACEALRLQRALGPPSPPPLPNCLWSSL